MSTDENFKIPGEMRDMADKGLGRARDVLGGFIGKARKGADSLQNATQTADIPAGVAFARGLEFAEQNVSAAFDYAQKLVRAPGIKEALQLQTEYLQAQSAALQEQTEELTTLAQPTKTETP